MKFQILSLYRKWQKESIDSLSHGYISKGLAISYFIKEGLFPLLYNNGYILTKNIVQFEDILASMMFNYDLNKTKIFHASLKNLEEENLVHYDYYCNTITYEMWEAFWKIWDTEFIDMFSYNTSDLCAQIQCLVWECVDLKKSSTYLKYLEETYESDEEIKRDDPYILDHYESNHATYRY